MTWFVPGRLEVFGKHTDYAGGRSLLAAVNLGVTAQVERSATGGFTARTTAQPGEVSLSVGVDPGLPAGHWGRYVQTVIDRLSLNFGELRPARVTIDSDLPLASGMSSSSALIVAVALSLIDDNGLRQSEAWRANIADEIDLAGYMATVENGLQFKGLPGTRGVGTFGGSEDHTAMLGCEPGKLTEFSFCPIVRERSVELNPRWSFVVAVSGVLAEKTGSALARYNNVSLRARQLVELWNDRTGTDFVFLADVLDSSPSALDELRQLVATDLDLSNRLEAFVAESRVLVPRAVAALADGDMEEFGLAANLSHRNADQLLGNQVPQTNALQRLACDLGAVGASSFGAGFGGSVWALVPASEAEAFAGEWLDRYLAAYPELTGRAGAVPVTPGGPARRL